MCYYDLNTFKFFFFLYEGCRQIGTYNSPEHDVQTNEPMVTFTYVGPL